MKLNCGIVGLPNVGKSTLFCALTKAPAAAENYPFCTIDPNVGVVDLPDERLDFMASVFQPKKKIPAAVDFVDIAGLIKGASKGEGLGNQFLANIRETTVIAHVVRCFDNPDIQHVREDAKTDAPIDPESDILTIDFELAQADLDTITKRQEKITKQIRAMGKEEEKKLAPYMSAVEKIKPLLQDGKCARMADLTDDEREAIYDLHLLTIKPQIFVCNIDEDTIESGTNKYVEAVKKIAAEEKSEHAGRSKDRLFGSARFPECLHDGIEEFLVLVYLRFFPYGRRLYQRNGFHIERFGNHEGNAEVFFGAQGKSVVDGGKEFLYGDRSGGYAGKTFQHRVP